MYRFQSLALLAGLVGVFAFVAYFIFGWLAALVVFGAGLALHGLSFQQAQALILRVHRARPLSPWEAPRLHAIVRELAGRAGGDVPALMVYPADLPNAFALGAGDGVVAVSTGLLEVLDEREITGVLAHEFAHLKNRDSLLSLSAGIFVQAITGLTQLFGLLLMLIFLFGQRVGPSALPVLLLLNGASVLAVLLQAGLMRTRERLADRDAALLSGDPRGLASALYKLHQYNRYLEGLIRRFRFMYTSEEDGGHRWLRTHPSTEERVRALLELERDQARDEDARHDGSAYFPEWSLGRRLHGAVRMAG